MYSEQLIKRVKEIYPDNKEIHKLADTGNVYLGRYLDDNSNPSISINVILNSTDLESLKKIALKEKEKLELYFMWCEEDPRKTK